MNNLYRIKFRSVSQFTIKLLQPIPDLNVSFWCILKMPNLQHFNLLLIKKFQFARNVICSKIIFRYNKHNNFQTTILPKCNSIKDFFHQLSLSFKKTAFENVVSFCLLAYHSRFFLNLLSSSILSSQLVVVIFHRK